MYIISYLKEIRKVYDWGKKKKGSDTKWGRRGCDRMVVGFTTTYAITAYHY
jgi:hypothetical protein